LKFNFEIQNFKLNSDLIIYSRMNEFKIHGFELNYLNL